MIQPAYAATMARYNAEMNRRMYDAARRLGEAPRRLPRGAFWGSIHATLSHLVWADQMWMSRFAGWERPAAPLSASGEVFASFEEMTNERVRVDAELQAWCDALTSEWLDADLTWSSAAVNRDLTLPRPLLVVHLFNHQTHHRGQVHAMITAAGETTGATDLPFVVPA